MALSGRLSAWYWRVFAGLALILLALAPLQNIAGDGNEMLTLAESLLHGHVSVPCGEAAVREGSACYSNFYPLQSVLLTPLVGLGRLFGSLAGVDSQLVGRFAAMALPALCTAGAATFCGVLARERGASVPHCVAVAVACALGTEALTYSRTLYAEPLASLCVVITVWGLAGDTRRRHVIGALGALACALAKAQLVFVGPAVGVALALHDRSWRPLVRACAGTLVGGLLYLAYNTIRFADPLRFGNQARTLPLHRRGFSLPENMVHSTVDLLVSPNGGLLFFAPLALVGVVALVRRRDRLALACLGGCAGVLLLYTTNPNGSFWGPRYLVPLLPLACVGLGTLRGRVAVAAVALGLLTFASQLPNVVAYYKSPLLRNLPATSARLWDWQNLDLVDIWPSARDQLREASDTDVRTLEPLAGRGSTPRLLRTVALWWWGLPVAGLPAWIGALVMVLMIVAGGRLLVRTARLE
jgi:hypothetical protein